MIVACLIRNKCSYKNRYFIFGNAKSIFGTNNHASILCCPDRRDLLEQDAFWLSKNGSVWTLLCSFLCSTFYAATSQIFPLVIFYSLRYDTEFEFYSAWICHFCEVSTHDHKGDDSFQKCRDFPRQLWCALSLT